MLSTLIHKKLAANAVILLVFLLAIATIRPMRLYREDHVLSTSLEPERISDEVTQELDAGEYFTAEYDHLQTLEFYVHSVTAGEQVRFQLFRVGDNMAMELVAQEDVALPDEVPGYAVVSVDAQLEVGATYVYTVRGLDETRFTVGYESAEQAAASGTAPAYQLAFYNDTGISGLALKTRLTYRTVLGTLPSIGLGILYLVLAVLAVKVTGLIFKKKPEWNTSLTILQAMQAVLTPVILVLGALAFIAVWPLKLFDSRPLDIIVYETGIVIAVLIALYALRHDRTGIPSMVNAHLFRVNVWHYGIILSVAGMLHFSADYMNATSDLGHSAAMNWIIFFLSIILILMGDASSNCSPPVFLALITAPIGSLIYCLVHLVPSTESDAELRNAVLISGCCAFAAAALAVAAVAVMLVKRAQSRRAAGRAGAEEPPVRGEGSEGSDVAEENPNARQARLLRRRRSVSAGRDPAEGPASAEEEGTGGTASSAGLYGAAGTDFPHRSFEEDLTEGSLHREPDGADPSAAARRGGASSGMTDAEWGRAGRAAAVKAGVLPLCVLAALLLLFHHTRSWVFLLVFFWGMFYLRFQSWRGRNRFLQDLCEGILLDFGFKVVYSLLHRYYPAYIYSRFPMHFHTPTVTAYYLIVVAAAALTLFTRRWLQTQGQTLRQRLPRIWKESLALGVAGSYLMMTLTRSGIGTFAVLLLAAAFCAVPGKGKTTTARTAADGPGPDSAAADAPRKETDAADAAGRTARAGSASRFGSGCRTLLAMLAAVLITFPAVFTGQRIISTVYAHPDIFEDVEEYDDWLLRNTEWNNTRFMNVEIFIRDFGDRILGGEIGSDLYYGLGWNIPQGYRTSGLYEEEEESGILEAAAQAQDADTAYWTASGQLASASESAAAGLLLSETEQVAAEPDTLEEGDVSNGRLSVYKAYLRGLNLTGHDVMGAELDSGELAVHAHNTVLQAAWDCGIPTGIVFGIVLVILLVLAFRYALRGGDVSRGRAAAADAGGGPGPEAAAPAFGERTETAEAAAAGPDGRDPYALLPLLLVLGYGIIGMVEWIFHFSNPFTIALLFGTAPVLFREKRKE